MARVSKSKVGAVLDATAARIKRADKRPKNGATSDREVDISLKNRPKLERDLAKKLPATGLATKKRVDEAVQAIKDELIAADANNNGLSAEEVENLSLGAQLAVAAAGGKRPGMIGVIGSDPMEVFDRLRVLAENHMLSSGGGVEARFKPFMSQTATRDPLSGEVVREMLRPQWQDLIQDLWADGMPLNNFQPGLGDLEALEMGMARADDARAFLDYQEQGDNPEEGGPNRDLIRYLRRKLADLVVVNLYERDDTGRIVDIGHFGTFIGGKTPDGHVAGVFTGQFVE